MELRFDKSKILPLSQLCEAEMTEAEAIATRHIALEVFPAYLSRGHLMKDEFLAVCAWKTVRSRSRCNSNDEQLVKEVSAISLTTDSERLRIQVWTLLAGVGWPTASVFLHFAFPDQYPILDYRALWSLNSEVSTQYTFDFWWGYTEFCRALAREAGVSMRVLDQALWKYSEINQAPRVEPANPSNTASAKTIVVGY